MRAGARAVEDFELTRAYQCQFSQFTWEGLRYPADVAQ